MGRQLQKEYGLEEQVILTMPILEGMDGVKKMSKSLGNYIGVDEEPNNMYGKTMSIPDELMLKYFELVTDLTVDELDGLKQALEQEKLHPRDAKMRLAHTLVRMYHGKEAADEAQRHFQTVFQKGIVAGRDSGSDIGRRRFGTRKDLGGCPLVQAGSGG